MFEYKVVYNVSEFIMGRVILFIRVCLKLYEFFFFIILFKGYGKLVKIVKK